MGTSLLLEGHQVTGGEKNAYTFGCRGNYLKTSTSKTEEMG